MTATEEIDKRARQMSDDEREAYITDRGWEYLGFTWVPPSGVEDQAMGGALRFNPSGVYSLSAAVREQLAREDPDARPDGLGRYYHGEEPAGSLGSRW